MKIKNAMIKSCEVGDVYNGVLGVSIELDGDGWGSGYCGGYCMGSIPGRCGSAMLGDVIASLLDIFGKDKVSELVGTPVRARFDESGMRVEGIGNFMKDDWFVVDDIARKYKEESHVRG